MVQVSWNNYTNVIWRTDESNCDDLNTWGGLHSQMWRNYLKKRTDNKILDIPQQHGESKLIKYQTYCNNSCMCPLSGSNSNSLSQRSDHFMVLHFMFNKPCFVVFLSQHFKSIQQSGLVGGKKRINNKYYPTARQLYD